MTRWHEGIEGETEEEGASKWLGNERNQNTKEAICEVKVDRLFSPFASPKSTRPCKDHFVPCAALSYDAHRRHSVWPPLGAGPAFGVRPVRARARQSLVLVLAFSPSSLDSIPVLGNGGKGKGGHLLTCGCASFPPLPPPPVFVFLSLFPQGSFGPFPFHTRKKRLASPWFCFGWSRARHHSGNNTELMD